MWTMRLRRTGGARGQTHALPTAAAFDHMPTATYHLRDKETKAGLNDNQFPVTFLRETTRRSR